MRRQVGRNDKYPETVETWQLGEPVPEWLSDRAMVESLDDNGNLTLVTRQTNGGKGLEIIASGSVLSNKLVELKDKEGYVCFGDGRIFYIGPRAFPYLYT